MCLVLPAHVFAGPFTQTHDRVKQDTETEIIITGPVLDVYEVTWTDVTGAPQTDTVTTGSALFKPHLNIPAKKGTTVTVTNTSEPNIPPQSFVASLFTPPSDVVITSLVVQPGSVASVAGNSFALVGGFTTIATKVDYDPSSPTFGTLAGIIPASAFNFEGTGSAGSIHAILNADQLWSINLAGIWGQITPAEGLSVAFDQVLAGTFFFNSSPFPFSGDFIGTATFFPGNFETICGTLASGALTGNFCASGQSILLSVPEPSSLLLFLFGLLVLVQSAAVRRVASV